MSEADLGTSSETAKTVKWLDSRVCDLAEEIERLREALKKITTCCSPFDLDPLQRALNAVEHCQRLARAALHAEGGGDE